MNILNALQGLGGQTNFNDVTFTPPLRPGGTTCTGDVILTVPLKNGSGQNKKTVTLAAVPSSGAASSTSCAAPSSDAASAAHLFLPSDVGRGAYRRAAKTLRMTRIDSSHCSLPEGT